MKIETKNGIAEPMPLSDIQENNKLISKLNRAVSLIGVSMILFFLYLIWLTYYIMKHDVLNNIVRSCL